MKPTGLDEKISQKFFDHHSNIQSSFSKHGIYKYQDLVGRTYESLLRIPGIAHKSLGYVHHHLMDRGFGGIPEYAKMAKVHKHALGT